MSALQGMKNREGEFNVHECFKCLESPLHWRPKFSFLSQTMEAHFDSLNFKYEFVWTSKHRVYLASLITRPSRSRVWKWAQVFIIFIFIFILGGQAFQDCAVQPSYAIDLYHAKWPTLAWFVFVKQETSFAHVIIFKWNQFHMCTVLLWTKLVVEHIFLWDG